jgi:hypothetical protein
MAQLAHQTHFSSSPTTSYRAASCASSRLLPSSPKTDALSHPLSGAASLPQRQPWMTPTTGQHPTYSWTACLPPLAYKRHQGPCYPALCSLPPPILVPSIPSATLMSTVAQPSFPFIMRLTLSPLCPNLPPVSNPRTFSPSTVFCSEQSRRESTAPHSSNKPKPPPWQTVHCGPRPTLGPRDYTPGPQISHTKISPKSQWKS